MAYGSIAPPINTTPLSVISYTLPSRKRLTCFPVTMETVPAGVGEYLHGVFNEELASGKTYPQEGPLSLEAFLSYFFGATTILALLSEDVVPEGAAEEDGVVVTGEAANIESVRNGRSWESALGGCYYIKPNYPGRASHNCNGGFLIPPAMRGAKIGISLGKSYLVYAPQLGYKGSVFNLVFKNNYASLAIWDRLGFTRAGLIPKAGRLKTGPNGEEEYVDAVVVWKDLTQA